MDTAENRVAEILREAEEKVRKVIAEAAEGGDYQIVDYGRRVAIAISGIGRGGSEAAAAKEASKAGAVPTARVRGKAGGERGRKGAYPRFEISTDELVKIGWSKKDKREYSHKVPRGIFDRVVKAMGVLAGQASGPFAAEDVIEGVAREGGSIPSYQTYVVLAFLRERGGVEHSGREGYNIPVSIETDAKVLWAAEV